MQQTCSGITWATETKPEFKNAYINGFFFLMTGSVMWASLNFPQQRSTPFNTPQHPSTKCENALNMLSLPSMLCPCSVNMLSLPFMLCPCSLNKLSLPDMLCACSVNMLRAFRRNLTAKQTAFVQHPPFTSSLSNLTIHRTKQNSQLLKKTLNTHEQTCKTLSFLKMDRSKNIASSKKSTSLCLSSSMICKIITNETCSQNWSFFS